MRSPQPTDTLSGLWFESQKVGPQSKLASKTSYPDELRDELEDLTQWISEGAMDHDSRRQPQASTDMKTEGGTEAVVKYGASSYL